MLNHIKSELSSLYYLGLGVLLARFSKTDCIGAVAVNTKYGRWYIRPNNSDVLVLKEVFKKRHFDISGFAQYKNLVMRYHSLLKNGFDPVIIDAGANIGAASVWFSSIFPEAVIFAIEPDAQNAELCRRNTAGNPKIVVLEAAIGSTAGNVNVCSSSELAWAVRTEISDDGTVPIVTVDDILSRAGTNSSLMIAKIDIEGFESELFANSTNWLNDTSCLIVELHDYLFPGQHSSKSFQRALLGKDFEMVILGDNLVFFK